MATPGRLMDLMADGACELGGVSYLVLDEADRMLDQVNTEYWPYWPILFPSSMSKILTTYWCPGFRAGYPRHRGGDSPRAPDRALLRHLARQRAGARTLLLNQTHQGDTLASH